MSYVNRFTPLGQDARAAYVAWADAVKQAGGVVTVAPHVDGNPPAARYAASFVFPYAPDTTLNPLFSELPDDWSTDGASVYYVAPADARRYAAPGYTLYGQGRAPITQPQTVPGESAPPKPQWYDDFVKYGKYALYGTGAVIGGLIVLNIVSALPRSRR